ncbi:MAG TPA: hypothetical protein VKA10_03305, partial [Prolixibacteraceae bacterium]|nr:hypothetical protein [Prolixibacteraceae bacterium]
MKKTFFLTTFVILSGIFFNSYAQKNPEINSTRDEQLFLKHADECLALIEKAAKKESITGVAVIAFIPGDTTGSWTSKMKVVGKLADA